MKEKTSENNVRDIIKRIKKGDKALKEKFLNDYKPFVLKTVSQITGKYINAEDSEEFSIGFLAFNEAIDNFNESINGNFFSFSKQNIKWKLTNYFYKVSKDSKVYPFTYFENETTGEFEEKYLKIDSTDIFEKIELKEQIANFELKLKEFNISFEDLIAYGPKHKDSKKLLLGVAKVIMSKEELFNKMVKYRNIPIADLMKFVSVSRRTIERNRKFIIAASLIFNEDFEFLRDL
jgi:RNA polymerase sigma factor